MATGTTPFTRGVDGSNSFTYFLTLPKYSLLPPDDWRAIRLAPRRRITFILADGTRIERDVSECYIRLPQGEGHTPVILGEAGDEALLGVVTLEILGLVLHPFNRTLQPSRMLLA